MAVADPPPRLSDSGAQGVPAHEVSKTGASKAPCRIGAARWVADHVHAPTAADRLAPALGGIAARVADGHPLDVAMALRAHAERPHRRLRERTSRVTKKGDHCRTLSLDEPGQLGCARSRFRCRSQCKAPRGQERARVHWANLSPSGATTGSRRSGRRAVKRGRPARGIVQSVEEEERPSPLRCVGLS
jgi:hypothetical protein